METPAKRAPRTVALLIAIICSAIAIVLVGAAAWSTHWNQPQSAPIAPFIDPPQLKDKQSQEEASVTLTPEPTTPPVVIEPGEVTELYIPAGDPNQSISTGVLQMPSDCSAVIEPPIGTSDQGAVFQCGDFAMPSTSADRNVVLAGHSAHRFDTVFNRLYPQGEGMVNRQVFLRTTASNGLWLEYQVRAVYEPIKSDLPYMWEVWEPTPGRLILVTCLQEEGLWSSERNFIVVAEFVGVQEGS